MGLDTLMYCNSTWRKEVMLYYSIVLQVAFCGGLVDKVVRLTQTKHRDRWKPIQISANKMNAVINQKIDFWNVNLSSYTVV